MLWFNKYSKTPRQELQVLLFLSLIDVIKINTDNQELIATVKDLVFSDHLAQILWINSGIGNITIKYYKSKTVMSRQFTKSSTEEFKNLLSKESWYEVFNYSEVKSSLKAFMDVFLYYFNIAFPYKKVKSREFLKKKKKF